MEYYGAKPVSMDTIVQSHFNSIQSEFLPRIQSMNIQQLNLLIQRVNECLHRIQTFINDKNYDHWSLLVMNLHESISNYAYSSPTLSPAEVTTLTNIFNQFIHDVG